MKMYGFLREKPVICPNFIVETCKWLHCYLKKADSFKQTLYKEGYCKNGSFYTSFYYVTIPFLKNPFYGLLNTVLPE